MDNIKIQILILITILCSERVVGQENIGVRVINNVYDLHEDSAKAFKNGDKYYLLITNKNCISCFDPVCSYLRHKNPNAKIYGVVFMKKDYLALLPVITRYKEEIPQLYDILFYFTDKIKDKEIKKIIEMPSPQLIIKQGDNYKYLTYGETLRLH